MMGMSVRERLDRAVRGEPVGRPVFAVYDWFVRNRPQVDWQRLFRLGLGEINHADIIEYRRPHVEIVETLTQTPEGVRKDTTWITDRGELHEWHLGEWRQEYLIKSAEDYRIMARAWEDVEVTLSEVAFRASEAAVGDNGVTIAQLLAHTSGLSDMPYLETWQKRGSQRELIEAYRDHHLITPSVAAHAPYSVSAADLVRAPPQGVKGRLVALHQPGAD